jgi:hypothetical protein
MTSILSIFYVCISISSSCAFDAESCGAQVVYKNGKGEPLFKDLPPASLGKLRPAAGPKPVAILSRTAHAAAAAGGQQEPPKSKNPEEEGLDDNSGSSPSSSGGSGSGSAGDARDANADGNGDGDDGDAGEIFVFRGVHSTPIIETPPPVVENGKHAPAAADVMTPAASVLMQPPPSVAPAEPTERRLGGQVIEKDLMAVSFSPNNTFREGELVVVPRSAGGFTYGTVQGRCECACPIGPPAHKHLGWRGTTTYHDRPGLVCTCGRLTDLLCVCCVRVCVFGMQ